MKTFIAVYTPRALAILLVAFLVGCSTGSGGGKSSTESTSSGSPVLAQQEKAEVSAIDVDRRNQQIHQILVMLGEAELAMADKRLTTPENYNAASFYKRVLALSPENKEAKQGLVKIVNRYIQWSDAALQQGQIRTARSYLNRAAKVIPEHPELPAAIKRLSSIPAPKTAGDFIALDVAELNDKSAVAKNKLQQIADRVRDQDARVIIEVPSDKLGRWVYQQMNQRHEEYRIRANLRLGSKVGIRLLY
ncbi:hypothetical protein [Motiliproteus sp. MSK22-1]|uniref:hypothetical protein n=1 Tax=Motiliproteus sp. MSK22-1 TaxID=1897630 RepID=UPI0011802AF3|nr:hypothetical protein [Motiliproteus sp. MSK22-1]